MGHEENGSWISSYSGAEIDARLKHPRNLIDNSYFIGGGTGYGVFPVNQRGQTSYANGAFGFDRWAIFNGTSENVALQSGGVYLPVGGSIIQKLNADALAGITGKPITISALTADGTTLYSGTIDSVAASGASQYAVSDELSILLMDYGADRALQVYANAAKNVAVIFAEIGTTQTAFTNVGTEANPVWHIDWLPDYGDELEKCQRHFQTFRTQSLRPTYGIDFRPPMAEDTPTLGSFVKDTVTYYTASAE